MAQTRKGAGSGTGAKKQMRKGSGSGNGTGAKKQTRKGAK